MGNIPNEGEEYKPEILMRDEDSILVNGEAPVEILTELIEGFTINFNSIDYSSVAGFVYYQMGKTPQVGDKIELPGYFLEVAALDNNKIGKVRIRKNKVN